MIFLSLRAIIVLSLLTFGLAADVQGQESGSQEKTQPNVLFHLERQVVSQGPASEPGQAGPATFQIISMENEFVGPVVTGAPYSAAATTETTQTLGDGNRIYRRFTKQIYRDSQGRIRQEQSLSYLPGLAADAQPVQSISIYDPVAGISYTLFPGDKTARKIVVAGDFRRTLGVGGAEGAAADSVKTTVRVMGGSSIGGSAAGSVNTSGGLPGLALGSQIIKYGAAADGQSTKESLGEQVIEGITAQGTRVTFTIPAGKIGNERSIVTVTETWYSPELQTILLRRISDPMIGETTYRLTNISRSEPPASLFELPADYKVLEGEQRIFLNRKN